MKMNVENKLDKVVNILKEKGFVVYRKGGKEPGVFYAKEGDSRIGFVYPNNGYIYDRIKMWSFSRVYKPHKVSKYAALLGQQKLKESFVKDLELVLSRKNPNIEKGKLNFIRYSEMKNWSVRELFGEDLEQADRALINKVYHMLFDIGSDFESVIRMLYSFRNGPKSGIKVADPEDNYEWTNKDGNEKYSTKNLPKAHFRWDWRRYTLSKESVDKITEFVDTILES
jgi:hypothetical protein